MSWLIRAQADEFFTAYQVLSDNYDTVAISTLCPSVVNLAFAVELYIKNLHSVLTGKHLSGHNIWELFNKLPLKIKQEIFDQDSIKQNPFATKGNIFSPDFFSNDYSAYDRFSDQIRSISNAFVEWRYSYEKKYGTLNYDTSFTIAFIEAIKSTTDGIQKKTKRVTV